MKLAYASLLFLAMGQASLYGKCNVGDRPELHGKTFNIVPVLTVSDIRATGKLTIVDGCTFKVDDFQFVNGQPSQWYGSNAGTVEAISMSDTMIATTTAPASAEFKLKQPAGAEANFRNVNLLRFFTPSTNLVVAVVDLTTGGVVSPQVTLGTFTMTPDASIPTDLPKSLPEQNLPPREFTPYSSAEGVFGWAIGTVLAAVGIAL